MELKLMPRPGGGGGGGARLLHPLLLERKISLAGQSQQEPEMWKHDMLIIALLQYTVCGLEGLHQFL
jgi:hypothetical protein